jgi:hypothetical protein
MPMTYPGCRSSSRTITGNGTMLTMERHQLERASECNRIIRTDPFCLQFLFWPPSYPKSRWTDSICDWVRDILEEDASEAVIFRQDCLGSFRYLVALITIAGRPENPPLYFQLLRQRCRRRSRQGRLDYTGNPMDSNEVLRYASTVGKLGGMELKTRPDTFFDKTPILWRSRQQSTVSKS